MAVVPILTALTQDQREALYQEFDARDHYESRYHCFRRGTLRKQFGYSDDTLDKCRESWPFTKMNYLQYRTLKEFLLIADEAHREYKRRSWYCLSHTFGVSVMTIRRAYYHHRSLKDGRNSRSMGAHAAVSGPSKVNGFGGYFMVEKQCPGAPKDPRPQEKAPTSKAELRRRLPVA